MNLVFLISVWIWSAAAFPNFKDKLPNGNNVPHPCKANYMWRGVGHHNPFGGGTNNKFGLDFKAANLQWTKDLCHKDSDGDGRTNGEELGDPDCLWTQGQFPSRLTDITHPGICTLDDGTICNEDKSWIDCDIHDGLKDCDVINEPETKNLTVRFPETAVPSDETSYVCMIFNLPADQDYHLLAYEPYIENEDVMHHILLHGCDPNEDPVPSEELNVVKPCGMGANSKCRTLIGFWTVGFQGYCINGPFGYRFGANGFRQAALEFHWNNPSHVQNYKDSSGMTFYYTPKLRPNDASIMITGQQFLEIPPGQTSYTAVGKCYPECSKQLMTGPINIFWATNHMHYLGHEMKVEVFRNGTIFTELTNDPIFNYDSPVEHKYSTAVQVLPGDEIVTTCKFKSLSRPKTTFNGDATSDEMCFGFMGFYPASNMPKSICTSWKDISICDQYYPMEHKGCKWFDFMMLSSNDSKKLYNDVIENCRPFQGCITECKDLLKVLFAENPCMKGNVYDFIRYKAVQWPKADILNFMAAVDSCKVELANELELESENTNGATAAYGLYMAIILMIFVQSALLN